MVVVMVVMIMIMVMMVMIVMMIVIVMMVIMGLGRTALQIALFEEGESSGPGGSYGR
jgi:biopolymer transport protein ExbB/TolQ